MQTKSLAWLLGSRSQAELANMAQLAKQLTRQYFGYNIELYTPIYLSNHCVNRCDYCSFRSDNPLPRIRLSDSQVIQEAMAIKQLGLDHVLMVTGEHPKLAHVHHFSHWLTLLKQHFNSVSLESQQLCTRDYQRLTNEGLDGVYLYQETYDRSCYASHHLGGLKRNFHRRLQAPYDMVKAGVKKIGLGVLLGLNQNWRWEVEQLLTTARNLRQLSQQSEICISLPRLRDSKVFTNDQQAGLALLQIICAARIYEPRLAISLSTREPQWLRDKLLPFGITSASVASKTSPGGHQNSDQLAQFATHDQRSVKHFCEALTKAELMPVHQTWHRQLMLNSD